MEKFGIGVHCDLGIKNEKSIITGVDVQIFVEDEKDDLGFRNPDGSFTRQGYDLITDGLIVGLLSSIIGSDTKAIRQKQEHLRYIIERLEQGVTNPNLKAVDSEW